MNPDIPAAKEKEEEEKKGGLLPIGSGASPGGGALLARAAGFQRAATVGVSVHGAAGHGLLPSIINFVTTRFGMTLALGALTASAVFTMYSLGMGAMRGGFAPPKKPGLSFGPQGSTAGAEQAAPQSPVSSLEMAAVSNKNFFDGGAEPAPVAAKPVVEPEPPSQQAAAADPAGDAAHMLEQAAQAEKPKMIAAAKGFTGSMTAGLGGGNGLAGGKGLSEGIVRTFSSSGPGGGVKILRAMRPAPKKAAVVGSRSGRPAQRSGSAMRQLRFANLESQRARGASASESQSYHAENAFEPAAAGGGSLAGPGISQGTKGASVGDSSGEPLAQESSAAQKPAPAVRKAEDVTPYTKSVMLAMSLLMAASLIVTVIGILSTFKMLPVVGSLAAMAQMILLGMATGMAATAASIGVMIITKHGQTLQGGILTAGGAITTGAAIYALAASAGPSWPLVLGGIAGIVAAIGALMSSAKMPGAPFN